jgi:hypothetical protein
MAKAGTPLVEYPMKEDTYQYGIPAAAMPASGEPKCYNREFYAVDVYWQAAHPTVITKLGECLVAAGDPFGGTVDQMRARLIKDGKDPDKCIAGK